LGVVLNQVDTRRTSFKDFETELKFLLSDKMFNSKISQLTEIADSPFYSKTVSDFKEQSRARIEFLEFSNEFIERVGL
jgi:cellulose biosynthesis protein BcsQ